MPDFGFGHRLPVDNTVAETQWTIHSCLTSVNSSNAPLEFRIDKSITTTDLSQCYLQLQCRVLQADGSKIADDEVGKVSTVINFGYSMCSNVDVYIQGQKISQDQPFYPWLVYTKFVTGCTGNELKYFLSQALWRSDEAGLMQKIPSLDDATDIVQNSGFIKRAEYVGKSNAIILTTKLVLDFDINQPIPDQTEVFLRFHRATAGLCLMAAKEGYQIQINRAELLVARPRLTDAGQREMNQSLQRHGLTYHCKRFSVRTTVASKNDQNCDWVPFSGLLPRRIYVFQLSQAAANGSINKNIFDFSDFGLKQVQVYRNNDSVPFSQPIQYDPGAPNLLYLATLTAINNPSTINFSSWEFTQGYMLMCFDLTTDMSAGSSDYMTPDQMGTLRIRLDWSRPLAEPVNLFCIGKFAATLHLDRDRNPLWDNP